MLTFAKRNSFFCYFLLEMYVIIVIASKFVKVRNDRIRYIGDLIVFQQIICGINYDLQIFSLTFYLLCVHLNELDTQKNNNWIVYFCRPIVLYQQKCERQLGN